MIKRLHVHIPDVESFWTPVLDEEQATKLTELLDDLSNVNHLCIPVADNTGGTDCSKIMTRAMIDRAIFTVYFK